MWPNWLSCALLEPKRACEAAGICAMGIAGVSERGGRGALAQFLADQLTLLNQTGQIMPTQCTTETTILV